MNVPAAEYSRDAVCVIVLLNTDDLAQAKEANAMPQDPPFTASRRKLARAMRYIEELDQSIERRLSGPSTPFHALTFPIRFLHKSARVTATATLCEYASNLGDEIDPLRSFSTSASGTSKGS